MNTFGERLAHFITLVGMRPAEFSREIGYKRPDKIYFALDNKFKPNLDTVEDIANRFVELNLDWLIRGVGEPVKVMAQDKANESVIVHDSEMPIPPSEYFVARHEMLEQQVQDRDKMIELLEKELVFLRELVRREK